MAACYLSSLGARLARRWRTRLSGQVSGPTHLSRAMTIASRYAPPVISPSSANDSLRPRLAEGDRKRPKDPTGPGTAVITKTKPQTKRPNLYRVLLLNDDYTPMEFVVHVLERFFNK